MDDVSEPSHRRERWNKWLLRGLLIAVIALLLVLVSLVVYWIVRPTPFDPLTFETVRVIAIDDDGNISVPQVEPFVAPSVYDDDPVPLAFSFCSDATGDFVATGNSWFVEVESGDRFPLNQEIESTIRPGCITPRTTVEIPTQIRVMLEDLSSGNPPSGEATEWYVEGELTPNKDGGVTAKWQSEIFLIIAERRP